MNGAQAEAVERAFMTKAEACRRLAVSLPTLNRWIVAGHLDVVRLAGGGCVRLPVESVERFVAASRAEAV